MMRFRSARVAVACGLGGLLWAWSWASASAAPKYYFRVRDVKAAPEVKEDLTAVSRKALEEELAARPEFTSDLGGAEDDKAVADALAQRGLTGYNVSLKIDKVAQAPKDPKPGRRVPLLEVSVKVSVFGTKIPGDKLSFSGEGESAALAEVPEKARPKEGLALAEDAAKDAVKQAVEQALARLSASVSAPMNESGRKGTKPTTKGKAKRTKD